MFHQSTEYLTIGTLTIPKITIINVILKATIDTNIPCTYQEKEDLQAETQADAESASTTAFLYIQDKEERIREPFSSLASTR